MSGSKIQYTSKGARPVIDYDPFEHYLGALVSVDGSKSLAQLGYVLDDLVEGLLVNNVSGATLYYTPDGGTAGAENFPIADGQPLLIPGEKSKLAQVRFYLATAGNIGLLQLRRRQTSVLTTTTTTTT